MVVGTNNNVVTNWSPVTVVGHDNAKTGAWGVVTGNNNTVTYGDYPAVF
jgi:hypothetical protein